MLLSEDSPKQGSSVIQGRSFHKFLLLHAVGMLSDVLGLSVLYVRNLGFEG